MGSLRRKVLNLMAIYYILVPRYIYSSRYNTVTYISDGKLRVTGERDFSPYPQYPKKPTIIRNVTTTVIPEYAIHKFYYINVKYMRR